MTQKDRKTIPPKYTWDLTTIFQNDNDFENSFKKVKELCQEAKKYQGQMAKNSKDFFGAITAGLKAFRLLEKVYVYASLNNDLDISNAKYQAYNARVNRLASEVESDLAFIEPEILKMAPETIESFLKEQPDKQIYRHYLDFISQKRGHVLSETEESLISQAQDVFNSSAETFSVLSNSDLVFPEIVDEDGKKVQLSNGSYNSYI
ncbi:MAG: oligoendopeptidase F, partial [Lactobacillaceae bacterium]